MGQLGPAWASLGQLGPAPPRGAVCVRRRSAPAGIPAGAPIGAVAPLAGLAISRVHCDNPSPRARSMRRAWVRCAAQCYTQLGTQAELESGWQGGAGQTGTGQGIGRVRRGCPQTREAPDSAPPQVRKRKPRRRTLPAGGLRRRLRRASPSGVQPPFSAPKTSSLGGRILNSIQLFSQSSKLRFLKTHASSTHASSEVDPPEMRC
jgi:hypothetical protein